MKKLLLLSALLIFSLSSISAKQTISRDLNTLPATAKTILAKHFPKAKVNHIKIDTNVIGNKEFDVVLDNGVEVEFDNNGALKDVEAGVKGVPTSILNTNVKNYLAKNYAGHKILKYEVNNTNYEVELFNGLELKFDKSGNFLKIDR